MKSKFISARRFMLFAAIALTAATGCKKENSNPPNPPAGSNRLEKVSLDGNFARFTYNTDGSLQTAAVRDELATGGEITTFTIAYNNLRQIREVAASDGRRLVPVYANNELARVDILSPLNELIGYTDYNFLNGRIKSLTLYLTNGGLSSPWLKQLYNYDANGNIIKTNLFVNDFINDQLAPAGFINYEYDGRINPQSPVRDFMLLIWQAVSANNVKKEVHVDQFGTTEETLDYTYTYNSRNLPARATVQKTVPGSPVVSMEMLFSYWQ